MKHRGYNRTNELQLCETETPRHGTDKQSCAGLVVIAAAASVVVDGGSPGDGATETGKCTPTALTRGIRRDNKRESRELENYYYVLWAACACCVQYQAGVRSDRKDEAWC